MNKIREKLKESKDQEYEMTPLGINVSINCTTIKISTKSDSISWLAYILILILAIGVKVLQPLVIADAKNLDGSYNFNESTMVLLVEIVKLLFCVCVFAFQYYSADQDKRKALHDLSFKESLHFIIPAILYAASNTLVYYGLSYINPALFHVFGNLRILIAAILYRIMMKKQLTDIQWLGLFLIAAGAILSKPEDENTESENYLFGIFLVFLMNLTSTCASIYTEKYYKKTQDLSIFYQNIVLYLYGIIAIYIVLIIEGNHNEKGTFDGFDSKGINVLFVQSAMGISLSFIFKYLDNIVYVISLTVSMFIAAILSNILFDFPVTFSFICGMIIVTIAIYLYYRSKILEKFHIQETDVLI